MAARRFSGLLMIGAGAAALVYGLPVMGQQGPESLLPPGFEDPPAPPPPASRPTPDPSGSSSTPSRPSSGGSGSSSTSSSGASASDKDKDKEDDEEEEVRYDVPPTAQRSLKAIGLFTSAGGGFPANAFGGMDGDFLNRAVSKTQGPLASRWGTIMTRRLLASRTDTPKNVNGANWAAERGWLLLRMGDAAVARQLVQQVDSGRYTKRLLEVSMPIFLANADLSGMCPLADAGAQQTEAPTWKMARPICASLSGEQGAATSLLNQVRRQKVATGVDYLLGEKAVGAGVEGRRSVKIEWDKVQGFNAWRHGISLATGVEPPQRLYDTAGRQVNGWLAQLPMVSTATKVRAADGAAALGVISNREIVDIYSLASEDPDAPAAIKTKADQLAAAYAAGSEGERVGAMRSLWDSATNATERQAMLVLTARAAALVTPGDAAADADRLIASMLSAGFDTQAVRWASSVDAGSLGWGLLASAAPGWQGEITEGELDDFRSNDDSEEYRRSKFLLAGLAGMGRVEDAAIAGFAETLGTNIGKETGWTKAISAAAQRGESGTVVLLAAAGLQGRDWSAVPPHHLYYIVRSLWQVGLEAEARMIAAEAVAWG
jgi:hypothetical protein